MFFPDFFSSVFTPKAAEMYFCVPPKHRNRTNNEFCTKFVQDKTITVKNSPARNLHRLLNTLAFISAIFKGLHAGKTLKDAVSGRNIDTL